MADIMIIVVATAVLSSALTAAAIYVLFLKVVAPAMDQKIAEIREISSDVEARIAKGVKKGLAESFRDIPKTTVRETTRTMVKAGSGLVEGGLSSFFNERS